MHGRENFHTDYSGCLVDGNKVSRGKVPYSHSHQGALWLEGRDLEHVPHLLSVGLLPNEALSSHSGPVPLSQLLSILTLKLSATGSGGHFTHTYYTLLARVLQKQSRGYFEIKSMTATGTWGLCLLHLLGPSSAETIRRSI